MGSSHLHTVTHTRAALFPLVCTLHQLIAGTASHVAATNVDKETTEKVNIPAPAGNITRGSVPVWMEHQDDIHHF